MSGLSVVIPTRDRRETLLSTLETLAGQRLGDAEVELVVVDNGSADGTPAAVRELDLGLPVTVVDHPAGGASGARNAGWRAARHGTVVFLGDDIRPVDPDFLRGHLELHEERPDPVVVLGPVRWAPELDVSPLMEWLDRGGQFDYDAPVLGAHHFYTANVSLAADLLERAGGFDERLPFMWEDTELGVRLLELGAHFELHPELLADHHHAVELRAWIRRQRTSGRSGRRLNEIHPSDPPLAPRPAGARWALVRILGAGAMAAPTEWHALPPGVRERVYALIHHAAYAQGYRAAGAGEGRHPRARAGRRP